MKHGHKKSRLDECKKPKFDLVGILQSFSAYSAYCLLSMQLRMIITQPTNNEKQKNNKRKAIENILKDIQKIPEKISEKKIKKFLKKGK